MSPVRMTRRTAAQTSAAVRLEDLPNIGPSIASNLRRVGVHRPCDLIGQQPDELYRELCAATGVRHDPCVLDVFMAAVRFVEGEPARPWWHYTAERKQRYAAVTAPDRIQRSLSAMLGSTRAARRAGT
jgi:hypothetical protein